MNQPIRRARAPPRHATAASVGVLGLFRPLHRAQASMLNPLAASKLGVLGFNVSVAIELSGPSAAGHFSGPLCPNLIVPHTRP